MQGGQPPGGQNTRAPIALRTAPRTLTVEALLASPRAAEAPRGTLASPGSGRARTAPFSRCITPISPSVLVEAGSPVGVPHLENGVGARSPRAPSEPHRPTQRPPA